MSYDTVEVLSAFAEHYGITYPMLSDEGSRVIREFGILNTLVEPDEAVYGIPFPGVYLVGEDGRVEQKLFHRLYRERDSATRLLRLAYGVEPLPTGTPSTAATAGDVTITAALATEDLKFMQLTELYVRLQLPAGLHVNGRPLPEGYMPTTVVVTAPEGIEVGEPEYPRAEPFSVRGLDDQLHVYSGEVQIAVPLTSQVRDSDPITLEIEVRFQACNEEECFLPRTEQLRLELPVGPNTPGVPKPGE